MPKYIVICLKVKFDRVDLLKAFSVAYNTFFDLYICILLNFLD